MEARFSTPVQTDSGAHPASCTMGNRVFPRGKERPGRDADPSPPSIALVKKEYSYTSTPPMGRTACTEPQCLYKGELYTDWNSVFLFIHTYLYLVKRRRPVWPIQTNFIIPISSIHIQQCVIVNEGGYMINHTTF